MNAESFEEVQIIGARKIVKQTVAHLFPEKLFIYDLVCNYTAMADKIGEEEYLRVKS